MIFPAIRTIDNLVWLDPKLRAECLKYEALILQNYTVMVTNVKCALYRIFISRDIAGKTVVEVVKNVVNCLTLAKDNGRL